MSEKMREAFDYLKLCIGVVLSGKPCRDLDEALERMQAALSQPSTADDNWNEDEFVPVGVPRLTEMKATLKRAAQNFLSQPSVGEEALGDCVYQEMRKRWSSFSELDIARAILARYHVIERNPK